jgi:PAS domain S-box-containing protein
MSRPSSRQPPPLYGELLNRIPNLVVMADRDGRIVYVSPSVRALLGFDPDVLLGDGWWTVPQRTPADAAARRAAVSRRAAGLEPVDETPYEEQLIAADGTIRTFRFQDSIGPEQTLIGAGQDITASKQAQGALRESEERYRQLYQHMREGVALHELVFDERGAPANYRLLDVNPSYGRIIGIDRTKVVGRLATEVYGTSEPPYLDLFAPVALTGEGTTVDLHFAPMGRDFRVSIFSPSKGRFATVFEDITSHRRLEEELRQAQKMEAVGRLAGGISHDFNNLLTVILGYTDVALDSVSSADPLHATLLEIRRAGERASALTAGLLAFSRKQVIQPRAVDLNVLVAEMVPMLQRVIGEDIELTTALERAPLFVFADPHQVDQVVMNLVVNARDAMPAGGTLTLATRSVRTHAVEVHSGVELSPGSYAQLSVTDTGLGMDDDTLSHLFEPFFTTKPAGKGTGLGLSTVFGIVSQSGGGIRVQSSPGAGSTFTVTLPLALVEHVNLASPSLAAVPAAGKEVVLVAEDELAVRRLTRAALERGGYVVLEAENGVDALAICQQTHGPIHLLVTDVIMPQMSGAELATALRERRPGIKVLFLSGYAADVLSDHGGIGDARFMQKPFRPAELTVAVRALLDDTDA